MDRIPAEICETEGPALEFRVHELIKFLGRKNDTKILGKQYDLSHFSKQGEKHNTGPKEVYHCST